MLPASRQGANTLFYMRARTSFTSEEFSKIILKIETVPSTLIYVGGELFTYFNCRFLTDVRTSISSSETTLELSTHRFLPTNSHYNGRHQRTILTPPLGRGIVPSSLCLTDDQVEQDAPSKKTPQKVLLSWWCIYRYSTIVQFFPNKGTHPKIYTLRSVPQEHVTRRYTFAFTHSAHPSARNKQPTNTMQ